jgi:uncharacterized membrane protein YeaQ/YmgE (transglycosylase-associated protein family)
MRDMFANVAGREESSMSIVAWMVLGLSSGVVTSRTVHLAGFGFAWEILLGISGCAAFGALAHRFIDGLDLTPLHVGTLFTSMAITVTLLAAHHAAMAAGLARAEARSRRSPA